MSTADNQNLAAGSLSASRFWSCFLDEWQAALMIAVPAFYVAASLCALMWTGALAGALSAAAAGAALTYIVRRLLTVVSAPATVHEISESIWRRIAS